MQKKNHFKKLVDQSGYSQVEIARASGLSEVTISNLVHGKSGLPRAKTIHRLSVALGVEFDELETILRADQRQREMMDEAS